MKKLLFFTIMLSAVFTGVNTNCFAQVYTCSYMMSGQNNSSHGCNDAGINTTIPSNPYPSLAHHVYWNGNFISDVPLASYAGTSFFSPVFDEGYGLGTWEYYSFYIDDDGNQVQCDYHKIVLTDPPCNLTVTGLTATNGTSCSTGSVSGTVSGNFCSQWTLNIHKDALDGALIYSTTGTFTPANFGTGNLATGVYYISVSDAFCSNDYSIPVNSCQKPGGGFAASNITSSSARVKWNTVPCALSYQVQYRSVGTTTWTKKNTSGNIGFKILTGLLSATTYEWQVRSKCNNIPALWSGWSSKHTFTTATLRSAESGFQSMDGSSLDFNLNLYPNPSQQYLDVSFQSNEGIAQVEIIDISGQVVMSKELNSLSGNYEEQLDIASLSPGPYLLCVRTGNGFSKMKFVKE